MLLRKKLAVLVATTLMLVISAASPALAHQCANVSKNGGAGSVGTVNILTGEETFTKQNGGFITITDGATFSYDIFLHGTRPDGAMAAGPEGDDECDGFGVDNVAVCLGF